MIIMEEDWSTRKIVSQFIMLVHWLLSHFLTVWAFQGVLSVWGGQNCALAEMVAWGLQHIDPHYHHHYHPDPQPHLEIIMIVIAILILIPTMHWISQTPTTNPGGNDFRETEEGLVLPCAQVVNCITKLVAILRVSLCFFSFFNVVMLSYWLLSQQ